MQRVIDIRTRPFGFSHGAPPGTLAHSLVVLVSDNARHLESLHTALKPFLAEKHNLLALTHSAAQRQATVADWDAISRKCSWVRRAGVEDEVAAVKQGPDLPHAHTVVLATNTAFAPKSLLTWADMLVFTMDSATEPPEAHLNEWMHAALTMALPTGTFARWVGVLEAARTMTLPVQVHWVAIDQRPAERVWMVFSTVSGQPSAADPFVDAGPDRAAATGVAAVEALVRRLKF